MHRMRARCWTAIVVGLPSGGVACTAHILIIMVRRWQAGGVLAMGTAALPVMRCETVKSSSAFVHEIRARR